MGRLYGHREWGGFQSGAGREEVEESGVASGRQEISGREKNGNCLARVTVQVVRRVEWASERSRGSARRAWPTRYRRDVAFLFPYQGSLLLSVDFEPVIVGVARDLPEETDRRPFHRPDDRRPRPALGGRPPRARVADSRRPDLRSDLRAGSAPAGLPRHRSPPLRRCRRGGRGRPPGFRRLTTGFARRDGRETPKHDVEAWPGRCLALRSATSTSLREGLLQLACCRQSSDETGRRASAQITTGAGRPPGSTGCRRTRRPGRTARWRRTSTPPTTGPRIPATP